MRDVCHKLIWYPILHQSLYKSDEKMGTKQTKMEGDFLPQTPQQPITVQTDFDDQENVLDPRSPYTCRTPLNEIIQKGHSNVFQQAAAIPAISTEHPMGLLRKRFFKGFSYDLNDPRSPSTFLNRTPLIFDEHDKTLNLDDTFSDLFVETKIPLVDFLTEEYVAMQKTEEEHTCQPVDTPIVLPQETIIEQDPRSPSIGVERTPIILTDDAAPDEDEMIEDILSALSLNISEKLPQNKPLERIKNKKWAPIKSNARTNMIYEDRELHTPPKSQKDVADVPSGQKRTPLSCVKNQPQFRSRSVEVSGKSMKSRLPLTSFDDTLHKITPVKKILRYSNMENIENSFEF